MKTIADLQRLRKELRSNLHHEDGIKIIVGMGTCGIAAGAREVMTAVLEEIVRRRLENIIVCQTGCSGMCEKEVLLAVGRPNEPRITYGRVIPADVPKIFAEHIVNGRIVTELAIGKITE